MKNTQKGFIVPLLIAIVAVLMIVGGTIFYYSKEKVEHSLNLPTQKNEDTKSATSTSVVSNVTEDFFSIRVIYPNNWEKFVGDNDIGSTLSFFYNTDSKIAVSRSKFICSGGGSTCITGEFENDPQTTIPNGVGDERYYTIAENYYKKSSEYTFVERGVTKINTPIVFYKENKNGQIVGLFNSMEDTFSFSFRGVDMNAAKKFLSTVEFISAK